MEKGWERPPHVDLTRDELQRLVEPAFPTAQIAEHAVLATGLGNTNVRFRLKGEAGSYVLRLHTRDPDAARRERDLMAYLTRDGRASIPVPPLLFSDPLPNRGEYPYAIWGFVEGTLLQDLFTRLHDNALLDLAWSCGSVLASLAVHRFCRCGRLGPGLEITTEYGAPSAFVPAAVHEALFAGRAGSRLGPGMTDALWRTVERASPLLRAIDDRYTLVHADYKRSNLVMKRAGATWTVAAVLDWEFACAGPPLIDVGIFLRAGKRLPAGFCEAFASGYREAGGELPSDWLPLSRLVDVVSLVTFLDDPRDRPRVFAETVEVLKETLESLA